ncbi:hypothetical protein L3X38_012769 [Prunus dulcis]|uniref:Uncharacterized protein n=1 Tax=Prunus dulcis TaxID=3755 RepID=A0AAD4WM90_PRUDU|nr:hypothetical protein L3X38_012769 [Prunus dulcis]
MRGLGAKVWIAVMLCISLRMMRLMGDFLGGCFIHYVFWSMWLRGKGAYGLFFNPASPRGCGLWVIVPEGALYPTYLRILRLGAKAWMTYYYTMHFPEDAAYGRLSRRMLYALSLSKDAT